MVRRPPLCEAATQQAVSARCSAALSSGVNLMKVNILASDGSQHAQYRPQNSWPTQGLELPPWP